MPDELTAKSSSSDELADDSPRKRRRWPRWVLCFFVLVIALAGASPYLLSTSPAVGFVTSLVSESIVGRLTVEDVSLAWFGASRIRGVRLTDAAGRDVLRVGEIRIPGGLARRISSGEAFGEIEILLPAVVLYETTDGTFSLVEALSSSAPDEPDDDEDEGPLPEPRGSLVVRDASVRLVRADGRTLDISPIQFRTDIETLERIAGRLQAAVGGGGSASVEFELTGLVRDGRIDPGRAGGRLAVRTDEPIDLAPLSRFARDGSAVTGILTARADVSLAGGAPAGTFEVSVSGLRAPTTAPSEAISPIDVRLAGNSAVEGETVRGRVDLDSSCGRVGADFHYRHAPEPAALKGEDLLAAVLTGRRIALPDASLDANGQIDLPALARAVPALLKIRPDVSVTAGRLRVDHVALRSGAKASARGKIALEGLSARTSGRSVRWQPIVLDFDATLVPGKGLEARRVRAEAAFGQLDANGRADDFRAGFRADLAKLHDQLAEVFDLGEMTLTGRVDGKLTAAVGADQHVAVQFDSSLRGVRWGQGDRRVETKSTTLSVRGDLAHEGGRNARLTVGRALLNVDDEVLVTASGRFDVSSGAFDANAAMERCLLAGLTRRAAGLGVEGLPKLAGDFVGTVTAAREPNAPAVASGLLRVVGGRIHGRPIGEKPVRIEFTDVRADPAGAVLAAGAVVSADAATVTVREIDLRPGEVLRFTGKADITADLARCAAIAAAVADANDPAEVAGRLTWSGKAEGQAGGEIAVVGNGSLAELVVGAGKDAIRIEPIRVVQDLLVDPSAETVAVRGIRVESDVLALRASGSVRRYTTDVLLDLRGDYRGDWQRLMDVIRRVSPDAKDIMMTGPLASEFTVTGPAHRAKLTPTFHELQARAGVGWSTVRYGGFSLGAAKLPVQLAHGRVEMLPVTAIDADGGTVRLGGAVDFTGRNAILHLPGEITVLDNVPVNREVAETLLSRFNPIFGHVVSAAGRVRLSTRELVLPLGSTVTRGGSGTGRLDLSDMKIQPGGVLTTLLGLGGIPPERAQVMDVGAVDFAVRDGAIHYKNFTITFDKTFDLMFRGAVRFDEGLDMVVSMPVRSALLRRFGVRGPVDEYARMLEGARLDVPLVGTRLEPKVDLQSVDIRPLVTRAAEKLLKGKAAGTLGELLKGLGKGGSALPIPGPAPSTRPGPRTRPADTTPEDALRKGALDLLDGLLKPKDSR